MSFRDGSITKRSVRKHQYNSNLPIQAFSARRSPSPIVPDSPPREPSDTGDAELEPEPLSEKHAREAQAVIDVFGLKMVPKKFVCF